MLFDVPDPPENTGLTFGEGAPNGGKPLICDRGVPISRSGEETIAGSNNVAPGPALRLLGGIGEFGRCCVASLYSVTKTLAVPTLRAFPTLTSHDKDRLEQDGPYSS